MERWTHVAWLVSRTALSADIIAEHGVILPEALIDRQAQPHAHRWLREQPLVCVSGTTWRRLSEAGVRIFRVAFDASSDRVLDIEDTGAPAARSSVRVALDALESATTATCQERPLLDVQGDPSPIDRVLRLVSGGLLDESSVLNAFDSRCVVEDGYGYRGALEGTFKAMDEVAHELGSLDALFGQIFERAATMQAPAECLAGALAEAMPAARMVSVPRDGGIARRLIVPALRVPLGGPMMVDGRMDSELQLPAEQRWSLDGSDAWSPQLPAQLS